MTAAVAPTTFLASERPSRKSFGRRVLDAMVASRARAAAREIRRHQSLFAADASQEALLVAEFAKRYGARD